MEKQQFKLNFTALHGQNNYTYYQLSYVWRLTVTDGFGLIMLRKKPNCENWYQIKVNQKNSANLLSSSFGVVAAFFNSRQFKSCQLLTSSSDDSIIPFTGFLLYSVENSVTLLLTSDVLLSHMVAGDILRKAF